MIYIQHAHIMRGMAWRSGHSHHGIAFGLLWLLASSHGISAKSRLMHTHTHMVFHALRIMALLTDCRLASLSCQCPHIYVCVIFGHSCPIIMICMWLLVSHVTAYRQLKTATVHKEVLNLAGVGDGSMYMLMICVHCTHHVELLYPLPEW